MGMRLSDNELVADLCKDQARKRPLDIKDRDGLASDLGLDRIRKAVALVTERDPSDVEDLQWLLAGVVESVAGEVDGSSPTESEAVERVRRAAGMIADTD